LIFIILNILCDFDKLLKPLSKVLCPQRHLITNLTIEKLDKLNKELCHIIK